MRFLRSWLLVAVALLAVAANATAQTTNGTLSGHVSDQQGLALPGVTINATSPNLQGIRSTVTSDNGDYSMPGLPSGVYTISFELSGFERVTKTATLAPTQALPVDAQLGPAAVTETVNVVGSKVDPLMKTSVVATNFSQELIQLLPTNRDHTAPLLMAPAAHPTGPSGNFSIGGAMSYDSRYLINGVDANETIRGQANTLYIEDAVQETTVAVAGISAEYGRFTGGVINIITKSGGNLFSGSFRDSMANDSWRATTSLPEGTPIPGNRTQTVPTATVASGSPYPGDVKFDHVVPTYRYTFGGPILKDHLWFFTAGRLQDQIANRQTFVTNLPYTLTNDQKRYEVNVTYSANANHRFYGAYTDFRLDQINGSQQNIMDLASLYTASNPQDLITFNYNGVLSNKLYVEGRATSRHWTSEGVGSAFTDPIKGTLLVDRSKGGNTFRYWTSTFCGACEPEKRDSTDLFLKGSYFKSTIDGGSHNMQFGYDTFNDLRRADNYQSGSNYRILGTSTVMRGTELFPQFLNSNTILQYNPLPTPSLGTNFRIHSLFFNDAWRMNSNLTLNLGIRWDKNHGANSLGAITANDSGFGPRIGIIYDPTGQGLWSVTASFAKYIAAIANSIGDASSNAGNTATYTWAYAGPQINANANAPTLVASPAAIQTVFDWCRADSRGFCTGIPMSGASVPGVSVTIPNGLASPNALEYSAGVGRQITGRINARADFTYRDFRDFYSQRIDTTTGIAVDSLGNRSDKSVVENTNDLKRRYSGLTSTLTYRVSSRTDVGANYTLSKLWGNVDGESLNSGPTASASFQYPEYRNPAWNFPEGDLSSDQRHRTSMWGNYGVPKVDGLTLSVLQTIASGVPYGAVGQVNTAPFVTNPGYLTPQGSLGTVNYYFTARDAFRTEIGKRTDLSASYNYALKSSGSRHIDLFFQAVLVNAFNTFDLCGCGGASVFVNGGGSNLSTIGQAVLTNSTTASLARFNPFTTTPVEGVNWNYGPNFGTATNRQAYTSPRTFRLTFGIRF